MSKIDSSTFDVDGRIDKSDKTATARPRDAATLILVRQHKGQARFLLGQRSARHSFMPKKYVFPGGAVDPDDGRVPAASELPDVCQTRVQFKTRRKPRAFALAAIRETFEETGLRLGKTARLSPQKQPKLSASWQSFLQQDAIPDLQRLRFIGRAITPPYRAKRFDARFFFADADAMGAEFDQLCDGAELSDLQWFSSGEIAQLDLPMITQFMIAEAEKITKGNQRDPRFVYFKGGKSQIESIA